MIRMLRLLVLLFLGVCSTVSSIHAQTWIPVEVAELMKSIEQSADKYKAVDNYRWDGALLAYQNAGDKDPHQREAITVWKSGVFAKAEHLGVTSIQDGQVRVSIDPSQHVLILSEPQEIYDYLGSSYREEVFKAALSIGCAELNDGTHYRVKFLPNADFDVLEFVFDRNGWLRRMDTYWAHPVKLQPDEPLSASILPKVVLELGIPHAGGAADMVIDPKEAVSFTEAGPVALGRWKGFEVIDNRTR